MDKAHNRLKVILAEKNMTNKRLVELVGKAPAMVSKWVTNVAKQNVENAHYHLKTFESECG